MTVALRFQRLLNRWMRTGWKMPYSEAAVKSVLDALEDKRYDFRTVDGIAADSGLEPRSVQEVLEKLMKLRRVRVSPVPDKYGNKLYTLSSRRRTTKEIVSETRAFLSGSAR
jgi:hypothetical protein